MNSSLPSLCETTILARKSHPGASHDHHRTGRSQSAYTIWGLLYFPVCEHTESRMPHFTDEEVETDHTASPSTATERCLTWGDAESVCVSIESSRNSGRVSPKIEQPITA